MEVFVRRIITKSRTVLQKENVSSEFPSNFFYLHIKQAESNNIYVYMKQS